MVTRKALITGVGRRRGIGAGIAAGLVVDGWDLALSFWGTYDDRLGMEWQPDDPDLLAAELRSLGRGIELIPADLEDPAAADALVHRATGIAMQPTGRLGTPDDVANLVRFLLSDQGQWINGQLLYSNGGYPKGHLPR